MAFPVLEFADISRVSTDPKCWWGFLGGIDGRGGMNSVFHEQILADKLSKLNSTQQCIESILSNRFHAYFSQFNTLVSWHLQK